MTVDGATPINVAHSLGPLLVSRVGWVAKEFCQVNIMLMSDATVDRVLLLYLCGLFKLTCSANKLILRVFRSP